MQVLRVAGGFLAAAFGLRLLIPAYGGLIRGRSLGQLAMGVACAFGAACLIAAGALLILGR